MGPLSPSGPETAFDVVKPDFESHVEGKRPAESSNPVTAETGGSGARGELRAPGGPGTHLGKRSEGGGEDRAWPRAAPRPGTRRGTRAALAQSAPCARVGVLEMHRLARRRHPRVALDTCETAVAASPDSRAGVVTGAGTLLPKPAVAGRAPCADKRARTGAAARAGTRTGPTGRGGRASLGRFTSGRPVRGRAGPESSPRANERLLRGPLGGLGFRQATCREVKNTGVLPTIKVGKPLEL